MKKILLIIFGICLAGFLFFIFKNKNGQKINSPIGKDDKKALKTISQDKTLSVKNKEYIDPSGFSFKYPENFNVSSVDNQDEKIYSWLEVSSTDFKDKIEIKLTDSLLKQVDDWFKSEQNSSIEGDIKKVKLADLDARQYVIDNSINTIALDKGVIVSIITIGRSETISTVNQRIIESFTFKAPEKPVDNSINNSEAPIDDVILEGEEVIE